MLVCCIIQLSFEWCLISTEAGFSHMQSKRLKLNIKMNCCCGDFIWRSTRVIWGKGRCIVSKNGCQMLEISPEQVRAGRRGSRNHLLQPSSSLHWIKLGKSGSVVIDCDRVAVWLQFCFWFWFFAQLYHRRLLLCLVRGVWHRCPSYCAAQKT